MEFKGTKGEWNIKHSESKDAFNVVGTIVGGKYKIARCPYFVDITLPEFSARNRSECEANAKLIASAPDLLEACKELLGLLEFHGYKNSTEIYKAQQAINKALN